MLTLAKEGYTRFQKFHDREFCVLLQFSSMLHSKIFLGMLFRNSPCFTVVSMSPVSPIKFQTTSRRLQILCIFRLFFWKTWVPKGSPLGSIDSQGHLGCSLSSTKRYLGIFRVANRVHQGFVVFPLGFLGSLGFFVSLLSSLFTRRL